MEHSTASRQCNAPHNSNQLSAITTEMPVNRRLFSNPPRARSLKPSAWTRTAPVTARSATALLRRTLNNAAEKKLCDIGPNQAFNTTGFPLLLLAVSAGTDDNARIGRKINLQSISFRWNFEAGFTGQPEQVRILIVQDLQSNGVAPTLVAVLAQPNTISPYNMDTRQRFKILFDHTEQYHNIINSAGVPPGNFSTPGFLDPKHRDKMYKKLNNSVEYTGTGGTVASIVTGAVYLFTVGNFGAGPANPTAFGVSRITFTDV